MQKVIKKTRNPSALLFLYEGGMADLPSLDTSYQVACVFVHKGQLMVLAGKNGRYVLLGFNDDHESWKLERRFILPEELEPDIRYYRGALVSYSALGYESTRAVGSQPASKGYLKRLNLEACKLSTMTMALARKAVEWEGGHPLEDKPDSFFIYVFQDNLYLFVQDRIFQYSGS